MSVGSTADVALAVSLFTPIGEIGAGSEAVVTLFRAVSEKELADIAAKGAFRAVGSSVEGKYFATTVADAMAWGQKFFGESYRIISATVSKDALKAMHYWDRLDGIGPAFFSTIDNLKRVVIQLVR